MPFVPNPPHIVPAPFPRLMNSNAYGIGTPASTAATYARYGLVITSGAGTDPTSLKALNPNCLALMYMSTVTVQVNNVTNGVPINSVGMFPGWWGTLAGTRLAVAALAGDGTITVAGAPAAGWPSTPFVALISSVTHATDEVVIVTGVASNVLTVTRGNWQSTAQAQPAGSRVAPMPALGPYPLEFYANVSPYCPVQPGTLQRWADYAASYVATLICTTYPSYDGVFLDNAKGHPLDFPNTGLDADSNNVADGLDGPDGSGVFNGVQAFIAALRRAFAAANAQKLIMTNGAGWQGQGDGMYFESYQKTYGATPPAWVQRQYFDRVRALANRPQVRPVTGSNSTVFVGSADALSGNNSVAYAFDSTFFKNFRFAMSQALMGDGYFSFDWCPIYHGQTWAFDECDKGAGTALTANVLTTDTALTVVSSSGFTNGQTIRVPHAVKVTSGTYVTAVEDELMTVNGAPPDGTHINVTRAASIKGTQLIGMKVLPDYGAGLPTYLGWMGQALAPAVENTAVLVTNLIAGANPGFETSTPGTIVPGNFPPTATFGSWTWTVQNTLATTSGLAPGTFAFVSADTTTRQAGTQSARIFVTQRGVNSYDAFLQHAGFAATSGTSYTLTFWAKGDRLQAYQVRIMNNGGTGKALQQMVMSADWTQYRMTFVANSTENYTINFECGTDLGMYWFDSVSIHAADPGLFVRDFEHAYVICNGTTSGQTVTLPAISNPNSGHTTYKKLAGTQDTTINSGVTVAPGATVSVASLDGIVLVKA